MWFDFLWIRLEVSEPMYNETTKCTGLDTTVLKMETEASVKSICKEPDVSHTNDFNIVTHVLLILYLLIAHVMLLNLLIAIFT